MERAPGVHDAEENKVYVWKLKKSVYGLKQAGRNWNLFLHGILSELGLKQCKNDPCIHVENSLILAVYVDDFLMIGLRESIDHLKGELQKYLDVKDLGKVSEFLSIKINRPSANAMELDQITYVQETLREFSMSDCRGMVAPLERGCVKSERNYEKKFSEKIYRSAVGNLFFLANTTRADVANAVCIVSQFCEDPLTSDWENVKHILQYLKYSENYKLHFVKTGKPIQIFCDADFANNSVDFKSISGYAFILAGGVISWRSRKQKTVATSTPVAEYVAMYECICELVWMKGLLEELGQLKFLPNPCVVQSDNTAAIDIATNHAISDRTKHVNVKYHFVRDLVKEGNVILKYVKSEDNLSDIGYIDKTP